MNLEEAKALLASIHVPTACSCERCVGMCKRSCWPTPAEANHLLDEGYAKRLMRDQWYRGGFLDEGQDDINLLCGAIPGHEGRNSPRREFFDFGPDPRSKGCVLLQNNLCTIHHCKPIEGRLAIHNSPDKEKFSSVHEAVAMLWDTDEGRAVVARWEEMVR